MVCRYVDDVKTNRIHCVVSAFHFSPFRWLSVIFIASIQYFMKQESPNCLIVNDIMISVVTHLLFSIIPFSFSFCLFSGLNVHVHTAWRAYVWFGTAPKKIHFVESGVRTNCRTEKKVAVKLINAMTQRQQRRKYPFVRTMSMQKHTLSSIPLHHDTIAIFLARYFRMSLRLILCVCLFPVVKQFIHFARTSNSGLEKVSIFFFMQSFFLYSPRLALGHYIYQSRNTIENVWKNVGRRKRGKTCLSSIGVNKKWWPHAPRRMQRRPTTLSVNHFGHGERSQP